MEVPTEEEWGSINVYYPKELIQNEESYPVVVFVNGTGVYIHEILQPSSKMIHPISHAFPANRLIFFILFLPIYAFYRLLQLFQRLGQGGAGAGDVEALEALARGAEDGAAVQPKVSTA